MGTAPIGVFDSGMGGLTVLRALRQALPHESYIYLGDTARLPYGTKDPDTIIRYATQASKALVVRDIKLLVIACNTATAAALPILQSAFAPLPVIGVIEAGAKAAVTSSKRGHVLVLATDSTIRQQAYVHAIHALNPNIIVSSQACSLFVSLAEEGWFDGDAVLDVAKRYLTPHLSARHDDKPDTVMLGCTHFPMLIPVLRPLLGPDITIVDSAETTAEAVKNLLTHLQLRTSETHKGHCTFLATDGVERFARVASYFLEEKFCSDDVEIIDL